jgi:hypothetical protein
MDVLIDVFEAARMKNGIYGRLELTAPWGLSLDRAAPHIYVVTRERAGSRQPAKATRSSSADGISSSCRRAAGTRSKTAPATRALSVEQVLGSCDRNEHGRERSAIVRYGGGGAATTLGAGYF